MKNKTIPNYAEDGNEKLSALLYDNLAANKFFLEALLIAKDNSSGRIWLIGSGVYKTLINILYGQSHIIKDWDFIVEKLNTNLLIDKGWTLGSSKHGSPKLLGKNFAIDLIALANIHSVKKRKLAPTIENYLSGVPLTVQAVAYDTGKRTLMGDRGIKSIISGSVGVCNQDEYDYAADIYGDRYSVEKYAKELGLRPI